MNKRERLLSTLLDKDFSQEKAKILDTTVRFILSDMGKMYIDFWNTEGPGVMVFQPTSQERSMFYWTLQEIHSASFNLSNSLALIKYSATHLNLLLRDNSACGNLPQIVSGCMLAKAIRSLLARVKLELASSSS